MIQIFVATRLCPFRPPQTSDLCSFYMWANLLNLTPTRGRQLLFRVMQPSNFYWWSLVHLSIPARSKFMYEAGQTYSYAFETSTKTNVAFASATEDAVLSVKGEALLTFRTACDVSIELTKTSIRGQDSKSVSYSTESIKNRDIIIIFDRKPKNIERISKKPTRVPKKWKVKE